MSQSVRRQLTWPVRIAGPWADNTSYDDFGVAADGTVHYYRVEACKTGEGCSNKSEADRGYRRVVISPPGCTPGLYGVSYHGKFDPPKFYSIDITNGFSTLIGPTGFNRISAMDVDPTSGILYAVAERPADRQRVLISIDRQTGAGTQIAELTFGDNVEFEHIAGMSFDSSGTLYGYGSWDQGFYTIDVSTGTIVRLGVNALDMYGNGMAFSPGGILYHVGNDNLNTVDLTSGLPTLVAPLLFNLIVDFYGISAMDYAPETGLYYAILKDGQGGATDR